MSQPDQRLRMKNKERPYLVLDIRPLAKLRGVTYSLTAGSVAAGVTKIVAGIMLPEAAAVVLCIGAFREAADATATAFNARLKPDDIVMREMKRPRFDI